MSKVPLLKDFLQTKQWKPGGKIAQRPNQSAQRLYASRRPRTDEESESELSLSLSDWDTWFGNSDESDEWNNIIKY
jgi:hypothetical protein